MKNMRFLFAALFTPAILFAFLATAADPAQQSAAKIRVLVVTGGHGFEKEPFFKLFKDNPDITYQAVEHPNAHALLSAEAAKQWDVLVLYDMHQDITARGQGRFRGPAQGGQRAWWCCTMPSRITRRGRNTPPSSARITTSRRPTSTASKSRARPGSTAWISEVHVADPQHPVTQRGKRFRYPR